MHAYLTIEQIHDIQEKMLLELDTYCRENNIEYSLWAGSLLGAIRHKGFIPWDDDVDVIMPRPDYERFLNLLREKPIPGIRLKHHQDDPDYLLPFVKLIDETTELVEGHTKNQKLGVYVDIFPIDGMPESPLKKKIQRTLCRTAFYVLYLNLMDRREATTLHEKMIECILKPIAKSIPAKWLAKWNDRCAAKYSYETSNEICVLTHSILAKKDYKKTMVFPTVYTEFRNTRISVSQQWDACLTKMYGDYMTPPPEDQQQGKHTVRAWVKGT